jgi:hypothetical protein
MDFPGCSFIPTDCMHEQLVQITEVLQGLTAGQCLCGNPYFGTCPHKRLRCDVACGYLFPILGMEVCSTSGPGNQDPRRGCGCVAAGRPHLSQEDTYLQGAMPEADVRGAALKTLCGLRADAVPRSDPGFGLDLGHDPAPWYGRDDSAALSPKFYDWAGDALRPQGAPRRNSFP